MCVLRAVFFFSPLIAAELPDVQAWSEYDGERRLTVFPCHRQVNPAKYKGLIQGVSLIPRRKVPVP